MSTLNFISPDAVYSDDLTTTMDGSITKIPYFVHISRRQDSQSEKMDEMEEQLETVKKRFVLYLVKPRTQVTLTNFRLCLLTKTFEDP